MYFKISFFFFIFLLNGCQKKTYEAYLPLNKENKWTYTVRAGLQTRIDTIKVIRETSIDGVKGWDIQGPGGITSVYWHENILKIKSMPSLYLFPSLPLLDASKKSTELPWKGIILFEGKKTAAIGKLKQTPDKYREGSRNLDCLKSDITLQFDDKTVELITWFHSGTGVVCQQQRTNNYLDISLEYLMGP